MGYREERSAIKALRDKYPHESQRGLARRIVRCDFPSDHDRVTADTAAGCGMRPYASIYNAIRRIDGSIGGVKQKASRRKFRPGDRVKVVGLPKRRVPGEFENTVVSPMQKALGKVFVVFRVNDSGVYFDPVGCPVSLDCTRFGYPPDGLELVEAASPAAKAVPA